LLGPATDGTQAPALFFARDQVDDAYLGATNDPSAVVGRKIRIDKAEVSALVVALRKIRETCIDACPEVTGRAMD
jgi:hypothetical protein